MTLSWYSSSCFSKMSQEGMLDHPGLDPLGLQGLISGDAKLDLAA